MPEQKRSIVCTTTLGTYHPFDVSRLRLVATRFDVLVEYVLPKPDDGVVTFKKGHRDDKLSIVYAFRVGGEAVCQLQGSIYMQELLVAIEGVIGYGRLTEPAMSAEWLHKYIVHAKRRIRLRLDGISAP